MNPFQDYLRYESRRQFLGRGVNAVGWAALASLMASDKLRAEGGSKTGEGAALLETHFPAKAKQVIYLHMVGGPA
jgi:hypothetical protein